MHTPETANVKHMGLFPSGPTVKLIISNNCYLLGYRRKIQDKFILGLLSWVSTKSMLVVSERLLLESLLKYIFMKMQKTANKKKKSSSGKHSLWVAQAEKQSWWQHGMCHWDLCSGPAPGDRTQFCWGRSYNSKEEWNDMGVFRRNKHEKVQI